MSFDFDTPVQLKNTHSAKYDAAGIATGATADDTIPMWVADMDFRAPQAVLDVLQGEIDRGVLGYYTNDASLRSAICDWMSSRHGWQAQPEWIYFSHGVIAGLGIAIEAYTEKGDGIILFTPVYHAFSRTIQAKERTVVESIMPIVDGAYQMDLNALQAQLTGKEKMLIFCSPHNPGGKLWSAGEINALADFCLKNDLILVSDEIHMDLTFPGHTHLNTAVTAPQVTPNLVTITAASKGFNIAGAETSFNIVEDAKLRERYAHAHRAFSGSNNRFGMLMIEAALTEGREWLDHCTQYLAENFAIFRDGVNDIPGLSVMDMPSTYLAWVDFSGTGMTREEYTKRVAKDARIAANDGPAFGSGGETHMRFNVATTRANVEEAVKRLQAAFSDLQ